MANRFVQAPSHGGGFRSGQPTLLVIHSLEAPARRGLAWDLANGWIQNAGVSPHAMTDPGETVDLLSEGTIGWHCGNGNQVGIGLEVVGYARYSFAEWTTGDQFTAVRLDAKKAAEVAKRHGIPRRWLSLSQIRNGESGFVTHADISATLGGTNHTDPGQGFPYAIFMQMVNQWTDGSIDSSANPNPQPGDGPGGADPKAWYEMALDTSVKADIAGIVNEEVAKVLRAGEFGHTANADAQRINDVAIGVFRSEEFKDIVEQQVLAAINGGAFAAKINDLVIGVFRSPEVANIIDQAADGKLDNAPKA